MEWLQRLLKNDRQILLALVCVYLLTRLSAIAFLPLVRDEALYAVMAEEQLDAPSIIPTFLGHAVSWKPAPFFWIYALFSKALTGLLPVEIVYRLPSFLFGLAAIFPLYLLLRNLGSSRALAFFSMLIFLASYNTIYPQAALLTDSPMFFLMCASLWLYSEERLGPRRFLAAGALAFAAFFIKLVIAFMIPVLAVAWFWARGRETLRNPLFLLSLLAVPAAFALNFLLLESLGIGRQLYVSDIGGHILSPAGVEEQLKVVVGSLALFIPSSGIWFFLSLFGFWKNWKVEKFMAVWYALTVFPVLTGFFMPWYYLPVMPAVAYFAALALLRWEGRENPDLFFMIFFSLALVLTLALMASIYAGMYDKFMPEKRAGLALAGRENVLIAGDYASGIFAYKTLAERQSLGRPLDYGLVVAAPTEQNETIAELVRNYTSDKYPAVRGSFSALFTSNATFAKDTNITHFDYVVLVNRPAAIPAGAEIIYNDSAIIICRR